MRFLRRISVMSALGVSCAIVHASDMVTESWSTFVASGGSGYSYVVDGGYAAVTAGEPLQTVHMGLHAQNTLATNEYYAIVSGGDAFGRSMLSSYYTISGDRTNPYTGKLENFTQGTSETFNSGTFGFANVDAGTNDQVYEIGSLQDLNGAGETFTNDLNIRDAASLTGMLNPSHSSLPSRISGTANPVQFSLAGSAATRPYVDFGAYGMSSGYLDTVDLQGQLIVDGLGVLNITDEISYRAYADSGLQTFSNPVDSIAYNLDASAQPGHTFDVEFRGQLVHNAFDANGNYIGSELLDTYSDGFRTQAVPEPSMLFGAAGLGWLLFRRRHRTTA
jgi:hypothetical protein